MCAPLLADPKDKMIRVECPDGAADIKWLILLRDELRDADGLKVADEQAATCPCCRPASAPA